MTTELGDETLMSRVAGGDQDAFQVLVCRHLPLILRFAQKTLGSAAEADDVAQEALLRIWTHAGNWRADRSQLTTWICTVVYRLCVDRLRMFRTVLLDHAAEAEDPAPAAPELLSRENELRLLGVAMSALEPRQRAALTLFYYEELSGEDAAAVLGISVRAYWSLLHRARQAIQQQLRAPLTVSPMTHP